MTAKKDTMSVVSAKNSRQDIINNLDIGDSVCLAKRINPQYGVPEDLIADTRHKLRGALDMQTSRARKYHVPGAEYTVENGSFVTRSGQLMIVAVATRVL